MPSAFLSHASEDAHLAERLARDLIAGGIDCFFAPWDIRAGESIRQRIDDGLERCTHFIILATPRSLGKPWVNAELDAKFVRRMAARSKLIALRSELEANQLPPLLSGLASPSLDAYEEAVPSLTADVWDATVRPPLGHAPGFATRMVAVESGLSVGASRIAHYLALNSVSGRMTDPQVSAEELKPIADLPDEDLIEVVEELESLGYIHVSRTLNAGSLGFIRVYPTTQLFAAIDQYVMPWNPSEDARVVASHLLNAPEGALVVQLLAEHLSWTARRMNPATTRLVGLGAAKASNSTDLNFEHYYLWKNSATRRLLREP